MADTSNIKGLEQARAKFAYEKAKSVADQGGKKAKEYKSYAKKLPMMIKTNGLGASLAFALSKSKDKDGRNTSWGLIYNDVKSWLTQDQKKFLLGTHVNDDLANAVIKLESPEYRAVTVEVLAFLNWLRRFAEGLIEGEAEDND
jgi:CRISPR-associated protein Cmr5